MPKRGLALIFVFAALIIAASIVAACADREAAAEPEESTVEETTALPDYEGLRTLTYECDYSMGTLNGDPFQPLRANVPSSYVEAMPKLGYAFIGWSDGKTDKKWREGDIIWDDTTITAIFDYDYLGLPALIIDTKNEREINSKDVYTQCKVSVKGTDGGSFDMTDVSAGIRGRGNATWGMEKKSYRLQLDEKQNLLGQDSGQAKTWVLMANHCDQSMLRHWMAFRLGTLFPYIEVSSSASFVSLYLNGEYNGVYLLCEQPEVQKNRVDIELRDDTTTGYFIELDQYYEGENNVDYINVGGHPYSIKCDETKSPEQVTYLKNYLKAIEAALKTGEREEIEELIDIDNCVDMYILQEFMKNIDVGWSSLYMYIKEDGGKLYFGPPWDFDLACGNDYRLDNGSYQKIYVGNGTYGFSQSHAWFIALMQLDWFRELVTARWEDNLPLIEQTINEANEIGTTYNDFFERNYTRWDIYGQRKNQEPEAVLALDSYSEHLGYLVSWCKNRMSWLDAFFDKGDYSSLESSRNAGRRQP